MYCIAHNNRLWSSRHDTAFGRSTPVAASQWPRGGPDLLNSFDLIKGRPQKFTVNVRRCPLRNANVGNAHVGRQKSNSLVSRQSTSEPVFPNLFLTCYPKSQPDVGS